MWNRLKNASNSPCCAAFISFGIILLPTLLIVDVYFAFNISFCWVYHQLQQHSENLRLQQESEQQVAMLDLNCIVWTLQTSLDGPVRLSALSYLATTQPAGFDLTFVVDCFDILLGCMKDIYHGVPITQGSEQIVTVSALCCLQMLSYFISMDPMSRALEDTRQRYIRSFGVMDNIGHLQVSYILLVIYRIMYPQHDIQHHQEPIRWRYYRPSINEHVIVAQALTEIAKLECQRRGGKVSGPLFPYANSPPRL